MEAHAVNVYFPFFQFYEDIAVFAKFAIKARGGSRENIWDNFAEW